MCILYAGDQDATMDPDDEAEDTINSTTDDSLVGEETQSGGFDAGDDDGEEWVGLTGESIQGEGTQTGNLSR